MSESLLWLCFIEARKKNLLLPIHSYKYKVQIRVSNGPKPYRLHSKAHPLTGIQTSAPLSRHHYSSINRVAASKDFLQLRLMFLKQVPPRCNDSSCIRGVFPSGSTKEQKSKRQRNNVAADCSKRASVVTNNEAAWKLPDQSRAGLFLSILGEDCKDKHLTRAKAPILQYEARKKHGSKKCCIKFKCCTSNVSLGINIETLLSVTKISSHLMTSSSVLSSCTSLLYPLKTLRTSHNKKCLWHCIRLSVKGLFPVHRKRLWWGK